MTIKLNIVKLLVLALFFASCKKEDDLLNEATNTKEPEEIIKTKEPKELKISFYLETETDLSEFNKAWIKTDLDNYLKKTEDYTVLAPTNKAFQEASIDVSTYTTEEEINTLKNLLLNNIVKGNRTKKNFTSKKYGYYKTLAKNAYNGLNLSGIYTNTDALVFNGTSKITTSDIELENFILHKIDKIINLPNADTFFKNDPDLDYFHNLTSYKESFSITGLFNDTSHNTIFAVINEGFSKSAYDTSTPFYDETKSSVENADHSYDFIQDSFVWGQTITLEDLKSKDFEFVSRARIKHYVTIDDDDVATIQARRWDTEGKIVESDIQAIRCTIHKIDKILGRFKIWRW